jgi:WD40 repeat protein
MNWINACDYSPDGEFIAFGCGSSLILWNPKTNEQLANIHNDDYLCLTFSSDGSHILTGCRDNTLKLWDVSTMRETYLLHGTRDILSDNVFGFSPDGALFVTDESQYSLKLMEDVREAQDIIKVWDSITKKVLRSLKAHSKRIVCHAFSPDGTKLVTGSHDNTLIVWDINNGTVINTIDMKNQSRSNYLKLCGFTSDGQNLISLSNENTVQIWDVKSGKELKTTSDPVRNCTRCIFSPNNRNILIIDSSRALRLWDLTSDKPSTPLAGFYTDGLYLAFAFSPDSSTFATKIGKNEIKIWDTQSGMILRSFTAHSKEICTCLYNPSGELFLTGSVDNSIKLWNSRTWEIVRVLTGHLGSVTTSIFSTTGDLIISGASDETLRIWETKTGKNIAIYPEMRFINNIAINASGLIIVIGSSGLRMLQLFNYENTN